jgi:hypothetical protein
MTRRTRLIALAAAVAGLLVPAVALAAIEHTDSGRFPEGYLQINPRTCKFLHHEIDQPRGPTWKNLRKAFIWEDARDDVKFQCLTRRVNGGAGGVAGAVAGYAQVRKTGTGHTVTVTCPKGDIVLGGGNTAGELAGSYPSSSSSWTIVRAHDDQRASITAVATCAAAPPD